MLEENGNQSPNPGFTNPNPEPQNTNQTPPQTPTNPPSPIISQTNVPQTPVTQPQPPTPQPPTTNNLPPQTPATPTQQIRPQPLNPQFKKNRNNRRIITSCISAFGCGFILFVIMILLGIQQIGIDSNPIAKALGINANAFVNMLVFLVNFVFGLISFITFIAAIVGVFKAGNARKDDKAAKSKGLIVALVSGIIFIITIFSWLGIYTYLNSKRTAVTTTQASGIITNPTNTVGLTAPVTIEFDATKIPFDNRKFRVLSINWDFGDGSTGTGSKISHEFIKKGETGRYTVTLTVLKQEISNGQESSDVYKSEIFIANEKVNAKFTADPETGPAPLEVKFDASESKDPDGQIVRWEWDFNEDGQYEENGEKVTHKFEKIGDYNVKLRVIDNNGEFSISEQTITVGETNAPKAIIEITPETSKYLVSKVYTFSGGTSTSPNGKISKYSWDFGDGTPQASTRSATHTFKEAGEYTITLTITDEKNEEGETTQTIKVSSSDTAPVAVITTSPAASGNPAKIEGKSPLTVKFSATDSTDKDNNIVDYKWDFDGDGKNDGLGETTEFTYTKAGEYKAKLTVIDAENNETTATVTILVKDQGITAKVSANPVQGTSPLAVEFDATGSSYPTGQITSYEWDFGDGSPKRIDSAQVTYRYTQVGTFNASVTPIGQDNKRDTATVTINVRPIELTACFESTRTQGPAPLTVILDPKCSTGTISKYSWDFGDGEVSRERKPTHTFLTPGSYTITLEISDNQNVINTYKQSILATGTVGN